MSWPFVDFQVNTISKRKKKKLLISPGTKLNSPLNLLSEFPCGIYPCGW